jgi:hypothetical protein
VCCGCYADDYSWDAVTDQYERLLTAVCEARGPGRLPASPLDLEPAIAG